MKLISFKFEKITIFILVMLSLLSASIVFANVITGQSTTNTSQDVAYTQLALNKPHDSLIGDLLLANISVNGGSPATITAPTGWSLIGRTNNDTNIAIASYWKIVGPSEPTVYSWSISPQTRAVGGITRYTGVDSVNPVDAMAGSTGRGTVATAPSVTTTHNNDLVIALFAINAGTNNSGVFSTTTEMTKRYDAKNTPFGPTTAAEDIIQSVAGISGTKSSTISSGPQRDWVAQQIALRQSGNLGNGLIAYWTLDGSSIDTAGNGHDGADTSVTYAPGSGIINQAAGFSATSVSRITIADAADLKPTGPFTINSWLKTTSSGISSNASILQTFSQNSNVAGIRFGQGGNSKMELLIGKNTGTANGTDYTDLQSNTNINDGNWHMWTAVYNGTILAIYLDGNPTPDASMASTMNPAYTPINYVRIGSHNFSGADFDTADASIDEIGFWSRALSMAEISTLYNNGAGSQYPF